nr:hypothetical protein CFP56_40123 [Quercus suber]
MADERNGGIFMAGDDCIGIQCGYKFVGLSYYIASLFVWSSDCLRSTRNLYSIQEYSLQCFLFLPNIFRGTAYNFQGVLCIPSHLSGCVISMVIRWT